VKEMTDEKFHEMCRVRYEQLEPEGSRSNDPNLLTELDALELYWKLISTPEMDSVCADRFWCAKQLKDMIIEKYPFFNAKH